MDQKNNAPLPESASILERLVAARQKPHGLSEFALIWGEWDQLTAEQQRAEFQATCSKVSNPEEFQTALQKICKSSLDDVNGPGGFQTYIGARIGSDLVSDEESKLLVSACLAARVSEGHEAEPVFDPAFLRLLKQTLASSEGPRALQRWAKTIERVHAALDAGAQDKRAAVANRVAAEWREREKETPTKQLVRWVVLVYEAWQKQNDITPEAAHKILKDAHRFGYDRKQWTKVWKAAHLESLPAGSKSIKHSLPTVELVGKILDHIRNMVGWF
jgi:hypothetical protein